MSYDILLAFQRCFPPPSSLSTASDTPCRPLLCQPFLVIHEIYTREVRTRSFDLIITFFHHSFSDISETRSPHLWAFSCATQLLSEQQFTAVQSAETWRQRSRFWCLKAPKRSWFFFFFLTNYFDKYYVKALICHLFCCTSTLQWGKSKRIRMYLWSEWWARVSSGVLRSCFHPDQNSYTPSCQLLLELKFPCCSSISVTSCRGKTHIRT